MPTFIKGNYKKSIFAGENGYNIGLFKVKETSDDVKEYLGKTVTFTGYFHELNDSDTYIFYGKIVLHNKYGEQFSVEGYERVKPEEKDSLVEFLSSGLFKGIGDAKAKKIVSVLGKDTLNIIINNPENLLLIPGINKKQIDILHNTLIEYEASYNTILRLGDLGFSTRESMIIYNKFKYDTEKIFEEDIYNIYHKLKDITFKKVDRIALNNGYSYDDKRRIKASIIYVLEESTNLIGNSFFLIDEIFNYTIRVLGQNISDELFIDCLNELIINTDVIKDNEKYYLKQMYEAEENIARRLKYLTRLADYNYKNLDKLINDLELLFNINYNEEQKNAIKSALIKNILIITGGPGTGKTTIIKSIIELYRSLNKLNYDRLVEKIALLAPTGRASKRLSETTLLPATTIHRFLKWNKDNDRFLINEYNKSPVEFVIIDEASMIDTYLMDNLLRGLKTDTKIILVGDHNQLPSVGPGQLLKDIIDSEIINKIVLKELYRQQEGSNIITLAHDVNSGLIDNSIFDNEGDLNFVETNDIASNIKEISKEYKDVDYKKFQILAPMYKTINGIDNLNKIIQDIFNPKSSTKNEISVGDVVFRENDKVLQLTNMPEENIFNGDIGIIKEVSKKQITIDFDGNVVKFTPSNYKNFKHGYAISIHKSQGSEFDYVIIPVSLNYSKMLYRKLYYTAITRCKKKLIIVGSKKALDIAINNNVIADRRTTLKDLLLKK